MAFTVARKEGVDLPRYSGARPRPTSIGNNSSAGTQVTINWPAGTCNQPSSVPDQLFGNQGPLCRLSTLIGGPLRGSIVADATSAHRHERETGAHQSVSRKGKLPRDDN